MGSTLLQLFLELLLEQKLLQHLITLNNKKIDELKKKLADRGAGHFASGWVWLAVKNGELTIEETHDGDTLADKDGINPLLTIDLWEHAYYLDHQNKRPEYLDAVLGDKINWSFASDNLARGETWKYSG